MKNSLSVLILLLLNLTQICVGQSQGERVVIEDLGLRWETYSQELDDYVPYIKGLSNEPTRSVNIDLNQYLDFHLVVTLPANTSLLIDDKLMHRTSDMKDLEFSIDSLLEALGQSSIRVTVFDDQANFRGLTGYIVDFDPSRGVNVSSDKFIQDHRPKNKNPDFFILSAVFILAATATVRMFNRNAFDDLFSFTKAISFKIRPDTITSTNIFSTTNLTFHVFYGVVMGISLVNVWVWFPERYDWSVPVATLGQIGFSGAVSVFVILLMYAKYPLIKLVSSLFSFHKFSAIHYFDYFRLTLIVTIMVFGISVVNNSTAGSFVNNYQTVIGYLLVMMLLLRPLVIFVKSIKFFNHRKLHLFSYLCTTEIIPLIILLKVFLK